ncbi:nucleotide exchange factor GrpE [candidate division KSB1 bacterium]|nr:nucleotide exchange factor GrpE [Candidatus Aminicenantes bacterium]RQW03588.1 MAG: nucleotide exchange factor GrpE [candidate division KSB1 bacterium]
MAEEIKDGIGYVPDDGDHEKDGLPNDEKSAHADSNPKKKNVAKKSFHKLHEIEETLQKVALERDELKDKYLRGLAEIDNFRKRVNKEKEEFQKYVLSEFLLDLLQIYDNLERALKATSMSVEKGIIAGVEIIRKQLLDLLKKYHVQEIDALGKPFDPVFHEALSKEERPEIAAPIVVEIYQKGFTYHDKLLRPVLTKVAIPGENVKNQEPEKKP